MRIVCPSCAATYEVADALLVRPRTVRCSRCAREWVQDPDVIPIGVPPEPEPPAALSPVAPPPAAPPAQMIAPVPAMPIPVTEAAPVAFQPQRDKASARVTLAWIASILALAVLAFVAYRYRAEIQLAWPPSTRLFRLLPG